MPQKKRRTSRKATVTYESLAEALRGVIPWTLAIPELMGKRWGLACLLCAPHGFTTLSTVHRMLAHLRKEHPGQLEAHRNKLEEVEESKGLAGEPKSPGELREALEYRHKTLKEEFEAASMARAVHMTYLRNWAELRARLLQVRYPGLTPLDPAVWKQGASDAERLGTIRMWCERAQRQLDAVDKDWINIGVVLNDFQVSRATITRALRDGRLTDGRSKAQDEKGPLRLNRRELESYFPYKLGVVKRKSGDTL